MSKSIQNLREERNALAKEVRNLMDQNPGATWNAEHQKTYDEKMSHVERIDAQIAREQKILDVMADKHFKEAGGDEVDPATVQGKRNALFNKWLRGGDRALTAEDWTQINNTMSTTTPSEGGYTVQTDVAKQLIVRLKEYGGMREAADVFVTAQGNPLNYPTTDGTAEVGELIEENATATDADLSFGTIGLNVFKFSSKVVTVPIELLQDSTLDIEGIVTDRLMERLGRITNQYFTTGAGTTEPRGVVTGSTAGKVGTTGQTTTVIYDDLIDLEHSVNPAYRKNGRAKFMMNDLSVRTIRKIKDSSGRPIFNPGYEVGVPGGAPNTLLGSEIIVNQDIATMAANAKSILYGDYKYYKIRDTMMFTLFRFTDSAYSKKGQVGFLAWMRAGGNLIDVSGDSVKHYANSAT